MARCDCLVSSYPASQTSAPCHRVPREATQGPCLAPALLAGLRPGLTGAASPWRRGRPRPGASVGRPRAPAARARRPCLLVHVLGEGRAVRSAPFGGRPERTGCDRTVTLAGTAPSPFSGEGTTTRRRAGGRREAAVLPCWPPKGPSRHISSPVRRRGEWEEGPLRFAPVSRGAGPCTTGTRRPTRRPSEPAKPG